jgi:D-glycero-D-manno-heptose 1,7-bisphosphate phosphatase
VSAGWSGFPEQGPLRFGPRRVKPRAPRRAAFLDRDGTLNEAVPDPESGALESPLTVDEVSLIPGAATAAGELAGAGYVLACVTNQPAAAKGKATLRQLLDVHERVVELLAKEGVRMDVSILCPHHPDGSAGELSRRCACRKPAPGMLLDAAAELALDLASSWMLGDTDADVGAGRAAGCRTVLVQYPPSAHKRRGQARADMTPLDLREAVAQLLDRQRR